MPIHYITGGCRSGKSRFAQELAESLSSQRVFIATSPHTDPEMSDRIQRHQKDRENRNWKTIEEEYLINNTILNAKPKQVILIDCLTLWVNNLMYHKKVFGEDHVTQKTLELIESCKNYNGQVVVVSNEVGLGIVPENEYARTYRDYLGRCNMTVASHADHVTMMISGIPLTLK